MRVLGCDPARRNPRRAWRSCSHPTRSQTASARPISSRCARNAGHGRDVQHRAVRAHEADVAINISRGGVVVTADLIAALRSRPPRCNGLDVVAPEPLPREPALDDAERPNHAACRDPRRAYHQKWEEILFGELPALCGRRVAAECCRQEAVVLRACLKRSCSGCQTPHHQLNHGDPDPCLGRLWQSLEVFNAWCEWTIDG